MGGRADTHSCGTRSACYTRPVSEMRTATVLTVLNLKGGVGKTHLCWLLAGVAQEQKRRILLVDTDAQGNLSLTFRLPPDGKPGIEALFHPGREPDAEPLVRRTSFSHIDLLPANPKLFKYDVSDQDEWQKSELHRTLVDALTPLKSRYDLIVIDCPPRLSLASMTALCAADGVIVPLEAADWGAQGVNEVTELIRYVRKHHNPRLELLGYVVSRYKHARPFQRGYHEQLRAHYGPLAFDTVVPDYGTYERSVITRSPVVFCSPHSRAATVARELFAEVLRRAHRH